MPVLYVSTSGNDTTGTGSISAPYLTIAKAISVSSSGDIVDIGTGVFEETAQLDLTHSISFRGKGYQKSVIKANSNTGKFFNVNGSVSYVLLGNVHIYQKADTLDLFTITSANAGARIILARSVCTQRTGYAVNNNQSVNDTLRIDVLSCVIRGATSFKTAKAFRSVNIDVICARNTIFANLGLVVDDQDGGQSCDLNFNNYFKCERLVRVGELGDQDYVDKDPQFLNFSTGLLGVIAGSPMVGAGTDLTEGYGTPTRQPPVELNWGYDGDNPDIGVEELFQSQGSIAVRTYNIHLILSVFASEFTNVKANHAQTKKDRSIADASAGELYRRWGVFLDAIRPHSMDTETYRALLERLLALYITNAPAQEILNVVPVDVYGLLPQLDEYYKTYRFAITSALRLSIVPPAPSLTVSLTGGQLHLGFKWFRVLTQNLTVPANQLTLVYVELDVVTGDGITLNPQLTTDTSIRRGFKVVTLSGDVTFRTGSKAVVGVGSLFTAELKLLDKIRPNGTVLFYVVDSIQSDTELTLKEAFADSDITSPLEWAKPVRVLGEVTTNGTTLTDLKAPGRLGHSSFVNTAETKGHGYHVILDDGGTISVFDKTDENRLLIAQLERSKPAHKLGFVSFIKDIPRGRVLVAAVDLEQSAVSYLEDFEQAFWEPN